MEKVDTVLYCVKCQEETPHTIIYIEDEIQRIKCNKCNSVHGINKKELLEHYTVETVEHILTEPFKLSKQLRDKKFSIINSLPKRLLTKPYRIIKEVKEILDEE